MIPPGPGGADGFRLKNIRIRRTVSRKIACVYQLQYECLTYLGGQQGVGRSISNRLSYRNHYMCSGKATSGYYVCNRIMNCHLMKKMLHVIYSFESISIDAFLSNIVFVSPFVCLLVIIFSIIVQLIGIKFQGYGHSLARKRFQQKIWICQPVCQKTGQGV